MSSCPVSSCCHLPIFWIPFDIVFSFMRLTSVLIQVGSSASKSSLRGVVLISQWLMHLILVRAHLFVICLFIHLSIHACVHPSAHPPTHPLAQHPLFYSFSRSYFCLTWAGLVCQYSSSPVLPSWSLCSSGRCTGASVIYNCGYIKKSE